MDENKRLFLMNLVHTLKENPDWVPDVISAVMEGTKEAYYSMCNKVALKDTSMLAALALVKQNRLDDRTKQMLNEKVRIGLAPENIASNLEKAFYDEENTE